MGEPRSHYQISLTARQAVGIFVALLLALGVAYFFGLMTGLSGRAARAAEPSARAEAPEPTPAPAAAAAEPAVPPVETGVPVAALRGAAGVSAVTPPPPDPTVPATLSTFEDSAESEAAPAATPGSRTTVVGAPAATPAAPAEKAPAPSAAKAAPAPHPAAAAPSAPARAAVGKVWIQAASLSSPEEAHALGARLSKHGFHAVVQTGAGPKGKVYRVRVGPYRTEEEASKAVTKLSRQEKIREPWIVPEGK